MGFSGCPSTNEVVDAKRFIRIWLMPKTKVKTNMVAGKLQIDSARLILVSKQTTFNANNFIPLMKNVKDKDVQWIDKRYSAEKSEFSIINRLMCVLATHSWNQCRCTFFAAQQLWLNMAASQAHELYLAALLHVASFLIHAYASCRLVITSCTVMTGIVYK